MSDFSLMDAIKCRIFKLPRVPIADNITGEDMPVFRNLWEGIRTKMPKRGPGKAGSLDPLRTPLEFQTALEGLYGHYAKKFDRWSKQGIRVPPCFVGVCNDTSTSKLVYDFISGFEREDEDGPGKPENIRLELFRNFDEHDQPYARPQTLRIDSKQLEADELRDDKSRSVAKNEIERFRWEVRNRTNDASQADSLTDEDLLREVIETAGKPGRLGESIRCVVSV